MQRERFKFSRTGFIMGNFYLFLILIIFRKNFLPDEFLNILNLLVIIYFGLSTWAFTYMFEDLYQKIKFILEKPFGYVMIIPIRILSYLFAPFIYLWIMFFSKK